MKKKWILMGFAIIVVFFTGCTNAGNQADVTEVTASDINVDYDHITGTYFYDYPDHSTVLLEDHYIRLERIEDELFGYYYGTTDDFDDAREGYQTGFFVSAMKDLAVSGDEISFSVQLFDKDIFTYPIALKYSSSEEISLEENEPWINANIFSQEEGITVVYSGIIEDEKIILKIENENRIFDKRKE